VMFTTPDDDADAEDDGEELPLVEVDEAGGPLHAAMASVAHAASATAAADRPGGLPLAQRAAPAEAGGGIRRVACIFLITRCSFALACIKCRPRGSDRTRAAQAAVPRCA
jgi:hypothetical protein